MSNEINYTSTQDCAALNPEDPIEILLSFSNGTHIEVERSVFPCALEAYDGEKDFRRCCAAMIYVRDIMHLKPIASFMEFQFMDSLDGCRGPKKIYCVEYEDKYWDGFQETHIRTLCIYVPWCDEILDRGYVMIYPRDECDCNCCGQHNACREVSQEQCITK